MTRDQVIAIVLSEAAPFLSVKPGDLFVHQDSGDERCPQLFMMLGIKSRPGEYHGFVYNEFGDIVYMGRYGYHGAPIKRGNRRGVVN